MNSVKAAAAFSTLLTLAIAGMADPIQEAKLCIMHRQLARAEEIIVSEMMTKPRDPELLTLLAEVKLDQNRGPEALELVKNAERLGGAHSAARAARRPLLRGGGTAGTS